VSQQSGGETPQQASEHQTEWIGELEVERISGDVQKHADLSTRSKARKQALDILFEADLMGTDPIDVLALRPTVVDNPVRDFAAGLVRGVSEYRSSLDAVIASCLATGWTLERMPRVDRILARIASYEILHTDVPNPSAVAEAVELGGEFSTDDSAVFLNGLLTGISEASRAGTLPEPEPAAQAVTATAGNTDPQTAEEPSSPEEQQPAPAADQTGESGYREHS